MTMAAASCCDERSRGWRGPVVWALTADPAAAAAASPRPIAITLSTRIYGLRMNPRSAPRGRNHETRRSEAKPHWVTM